MRFATPRATPAARLPAPSIPPLVEVQRPPLLRAPVTVFTPVGEFEMREGSLLVGRLPECDVVLDDGLVSRMHARLGVHDGSVMVEDLHSTNGLYVNGARIIRSARLREGDRVLLGTTEISLFEARPVSFLAALREHREGQEVQLPSLSIPRDARAPVPPTLPARPGTTFGKLELHLDEPLFERSDSAAPKSESVDMNAWADPSYQVSSTVRVGALGVIGALAEHLAASGNVDGAQRVLSTHLRHILQGAMSGVVVTEDVRALAARHALSLARWTQQSRWLDYVVELHVAAGRAMSPETCDVFERVADSLGQFDRSLFDYYLAGLYVRRRLLTAAEREVLKRQIRLAKGAG